MAIVNHLRSLREYVEALNAIGEIQEIDAEVDWNLELGAIVQRSYALACAGAAVQSHPRDRGGVPGPGRPGRREPNGRPGADRPVARLACRDARLPTRRGPGGGPRPHAAAAAAACRTAPARNTSTSARTVDLERLPAPLIHAGDGGRYVNTWGTVVVQTPDRTWTNWSIARIMLAGKNTLTGLVLPRQHLGMIYAQWKTARPAHAVCLGHRHAAG